LTLERANCLLALSDLRVDELELPLAHDLLAVEECLFAVQQCLHRWCSRAEIGCLPVPKRPRPFERETDRGAARL